MKLYRSAFTALLRFSILIFPYQWDSTCNKKPYSRLVWRGGSF